MSYPPAVFAGKQWRSIVFAYVGASLLGGLALGLLVWLVGAPLRLIEAALTQAFLLTVLTLSFVRDLLWRFPIPQRRVQVNAAGRTLLPPWQSAFVYGLTLGLGFLTFVPFASYFVLLGVLALSATVVDSMLLGASFGVGRAALVPSLAVFASDASRARSLVGSMYRRRRLMGALAWCAAAGLVLT